MSYFKFEGKKTLKVSKLEKDQDLLEEMFERLGFEDYIDLVSLCAAIAILFRDNDKELPGKRLGVTEKLAGIDAFNKADLYDHLILDYIGQDEDRLEKFHELYYEGFNLLRNWFKEIDKEARNELERFCLICDRVEAK
jgi:hypothetical protein